MARQIVRTVSKTRTRVKKNGSVNNAGYRQCNMCHGTGIVKVGKRKKT